MSYHIKLLIQTLLIISGLLSALEPASARTRQAGCPTRSPETSASVKELDAIYVSHQKWLDAYNLRIGSWTNRRAAEVSKILTDSRRAIVCSNNFAGRNLSQQVWIGANFIRGKFQGVDLSKADFSKALLNDSSFIGANLSHTVFFDAHLTKARFNRAEATGVKFEKANLQRAVFNGATLVDASFKKATLNRANLLNTNLRSAKFIDADLSLALFDGADMTGVIFEPKAGKLAPAASFARARNLDQMTFINSAAGLIELRQEFRNSGLAQEAREITFAIRKTQRQQKWHGDVQDRIDSAFQLILFELPSDYGLAMGRPLLILLVGILVFSIPYFVALRWPTNDGIWRIWSKERARQDIGEVTPELIQVDLFRGAIFYALYFSVLSAFHLGWRDLNVGTWLSRIQPKEYALVATGWVRTIAGVQSILSVYLVALWALSYFGQPFG